MVYPSSYWLRHMAATAHERFRLLWNNTERVATLLALLFTLLFIMGFRIDKPGERFAKLERADSTFAAELASYKTTTGKQVDMLYRVQCLQLTHLQAVMMGECQGYETAPDTDVVVRRRRLR